MAGQTLARAEYLIADPSRGAAGTIRDAALVIDGNTIAAVGPWSELEPRYRHLTPLGGPDGWLACPRHSGKRFAHDSTTREFA